MSIIRRRAAISFVLMSLVAVVFLFFFVFQQGQGGEKLEPPYLAITWQPGEQEPSATEIGNTFALYIELAKGDTGGFLTVGKVSLYGIAEEGSKELIITVTGIAVRDEIVVPNNLLLEAAGVWWELNVSEETVVWLLPDEYLITSFWE